MNIYIYLYIGCEVNILQNILCTVVKNSGLNVDNFRQSFKKLLGLLKQIRIY